MPADDAAADRLPLPAQPAGSGRNVAALLLVLLPLAACFATRPALFLMTLAAFSLVAYRFGALRFFLFTVIGALLLNACVLSAFAIFSDADNYLQPSIRLLASSLSPEQADGHLSLQHLILPQGFAAWSAVLYRLTGWLDAGNALVFMLLPAAWTVLRRELSSLQSLVLIAAPLTFLSCFSAMPDGPLYLLLLMAVVSLRSNAFWLPLAAVCVACTFKTTAWIPAALIGFVLLRDHPRKAWKLFLAAVFTAFLVWPTLRALFDGSAPAVSGDFEGMNATARTMGYFARNAYAYLGHWTVPGPAPDFNIAVGGGDGGGVDGLGPSFRLAVWGALALMTLCRKKMQGWGTVLLVCWGSVLVIPTLYIGYARYTPLVYVAGLLPWVLALPKIAPVPALLVCAMPVAWIGWRVMLSTENLTVVATPVVEVRSDVYNVRCGLRKHLRAEPFPENAPGTLSGSLMYTYRNPNPGDSCFPPMPRSTDGNPRLVPASDKASSMAGYALKTWLPWAIRSLPDLALKTLSYRFDTFTSFPRGADDVQPNHP